MGDQSRRALLTAMATGGTMMALSSMPAYAATENKPFYNAITDVGCVPDGFIETYSRDNRTWNHLDGRQIAKGTDNGPRINEFLKKIASQGGGIIYFPPGNYLVSGIDLEPGTGLQGSGMFNTRITLTDNANRSVIANRLANATQGNAFGVSVRDLCVDGNRWGQRGLNWNKKPSYELKDPHVAQSHGILLHRLPTKLDSSIDSYGLIENVQVEFCWGSGVNTREHGGEVRVINTHVKRVGGHGFVTGWDMQMYGCTSGESEYDGFRIQHGSTVIASCKAFRAGVMAHDGLRHGNAYPGKEASGFHTSGAGHVVLTGINAQNNTGTGITLENVKGVNLTGLSDSNNMHAIETNEGKWIVVDRKFYNDKAQREYEKANGIDSNLRLAKPWTFSAVELRGSWCTNNTLNVTTWASQTQNGTPIGYNRHGLTIRDGASGNHIIINHTRQATGQPPNSR